ncbi:MAG: TSUP family transporter [Rhodospirillales bacterium]
METLIGYLIHNTGLGLWEFWVLCSVSFIGSLITAALGLGGGVLTLATMALLMSPTVLIPVHAVVQLGSNFGRALLMFRDVVGEILPMLLLGTIIGAVVGGNVVIVLPIAILQVILAIFILYSVWTPSFQAKKPRKRAFILVGAIGAFTTMFVGATGPVIAPFVIAASKGRKEIVATHAACMTIQHAFKIITFGFIGFVFSPYIPLLIGLLLFGFGGTFFGKLLLNRLPENLFSILLKIILTLMAFKLFYDAMASW